MEKIKLYSTFIFSIVSSAIIFSACSSSAQSTTSTTNVTPSPQTSSSPSAQSQTFTAAQVAEHKTTESCYISFKGQVYDITTFIPTHPGGPGIARACGTSVDEFSNSHRGGSFDSPGMQQLLKKLLIGRLKN